MNRNINVASNNKGFTLIEVLVVLAIMGLFLGMSLQVFGNKAEQKRFDETRARMTEIKKAILDSLNDYVNGHRQFIGYIVDMGNLPELVDVGGGNLQPVGLWTNQSPPLPGTLTSWQYGTPSMVWMGWRGPYIETPSRGDNILRDGWGNPFHFGTSGISGKNMVIESYGADNKDDTGEETGYDVDLEMMIKGTEYLGAVAGRVDNGVTAVSIYYPANGMQIIRTISGLIDGDYFRFEESAPAPGDIDIPVGLRSIQITGGSGNTRIITIEPTGNFLGTLE